MDTDPQTSQGHSTPGLMTYTPAQAAGILEVSPASLRRIASQYESIYGDLPRNDRNDRLWTDEALEVITQAQALRDSGRASSLPEALKLLRAGLVDSEEIERAEFKRDPMDTIVEELRALRQAVEGLQAENLELKEQLKALPAAGGEMQDRQAAVIEALVMEVGAMNEQLKALTRSSDTQPTDKAAYVAEMEQIHTDEELEEERRRVMELNRRIEYLHGELERRDSALVRSIDGKRKRPWWQWWRRS
jgi:DNA-binding transcriptional MerR regulator